MIKVICYKRDRKYYLPSFGYINFTKLLQLFKDDDIEVIHHGGYENLAVDITLETKRKLLNHFEKQKIDKMTMLELNAALLKLCNRSYTSG